jgi:3-oxoacyl-[acyl-carrier protein] reductase
MLSMVGERNIRMDLELRGLNAVVTGATKGIGLAIARSLAAEGVDLVLVARTNAALNSIAGELSAEHRVRASAVAADLACEAGVEHLAAVIRDRNITPDIVVNNAGATIGGSLLTLNIEAWRSSHELKLWGYMLLTRALLPLMYEKGSGVILNIIGNGGAYPSHRFIAGCVANAALMNFTRALADEAGPHGVRVVAINPGPIRTDRLQALATHVAKERHVTADAAETLVTSNCPLGRIGEPEDVATVATFLVSPRAGYITGATIPVDGGGSIRDL